MRKRAEPIPTFASEAEERRFWESRDSTQYVDWSAAERVRLPNLKPSTTSDLAAPADQHARADQGRGSQARRSLPVADQDLARREARRQLTARNVATSGPLGGAVERGPRRRTHSDAGVQRPRRGLTDMSLQ